MLVPKLRFEEFKYEWSYYTFKELISLKSNTYNPQKDRKEYNCIELEHINQENGTINGYTGSRGQKSCKNFFKKGSILFGKLRPYLKKYWLASFSGVCSSEIWVLNSKNTQVINNGFIFYIIQSHYFIELCKLSTGSKMPRADWSYIKEQSVAIPGVEEQKKISKLLLLLDKKIELQQRKIEALKIYKTGVCQKLFQSIKDDKTTFKMQISKFLKERKIYSEKGLEYPHVTLSKDGILDKSNRYNRDFLVMSNNKEYKITLLNDLCYNPANLKFGVICINEYGSAIFSPIYVTLEINPNIMDVSFCKYYFTRIDFINKVRKYEQGTVYERMSVNVEDFLKHTDVFPCLENQRKIAKILSNLDRKINLQKNTLNNLNILKKSLLQQMFI